LAESGRGLFMLNALAREVSVQRIGARNRVAVALPLEPD
jgi:anti-sigma regulatory factor (Ser/Thr protein kinase)